MPIRKTKKVVKKTAEIPYEYKQGAIAIFFIIVAILVIILDDNSTLGEFIKKIFNN
jgi:hypothetical protein